MYFYGYFYNLNILSTNRYWFIYRSKQKGLKCMAICLSGINKTITPAITSEHPLYGLMENRTSNTYLFDN